MSAQLQRIIKRPIIKSLPSYLSDSDSKDSENKENEYKYPYPFSNNIISMSFSSVLPILSQQLRKRPIVKSLPSTIFHSDSKESGENEYKKSSNSFTKNNLDISVSNITSFFNSSSRDKNDATNKIREKILKFISNPPKEYFDDEEFGKYWHIVHTEWNNAIKKIAEDTQIPFYTHTTNNIKGGRSFNYDMDVIYYNGTNIIATRKIEFKNGGMNISNLPQFLSLQAKVNLFDETYDKFYYEYYLDKYIACDSDITEIKPSLQVYLKEVTNTKFEEVTNKKFKEVTNKKYNISPFFGQLKNRELFFQKEKNDVVNASITDYLTRYGKNINIQLFSEKVKSTQSDKIYLLWSNKTFYFDKLSDDEMSNMEFHSIRNGNVLEIKSGNTIYELLLRWRNHKGILNPAWQIGMKRKI